MKKILCAVVLASTSSSAFAVNYLGTNFVAPNVKGYENVANEIPGEIVYDTSRGGGTFWGYSNINGWTSLSGAGSASGTPAGTVIAFAGEACPTGYTLANGGELDKSEAPDLYMAIQDLYGTPSVTTKFRLPDYRGQFLRGVAGDTNVDPDKNSRTPSKSGLASNAVGSTQLDGFKSHTHSMSIGGDGVANGGIQRSANDFFLKQSTATGGNETRPVNVYVNYCIKK